MRHEETAFLTFRENGNRESIYILTYPDEDGETAISYYFDYMTALRFGTQAKAAFQIRKYPVGSGKSVYEAGSGIYHADGLSTTGFDENSKVVFFENCETPSDDAPGTWGERFDHIFYEVPNPFERGDIVRQVGTERYGIIETSQKDWLDLLKRFQSPEWTSPLDREDVQIRMALLDEDGDFFHQHINPVDLERHRPDGKSAFVGGDARDALLLCASELYQGKGSLDDFGYFQGQYRKVKGGR